MLSLLISCQSSPTLYLRSSSTLPFLRNPSQTTLASAQLGYFGLLGAGQILDHFYTCPCSSLELQPASPTLSNTLPIPGPHLPFHSPPLFLLSPPVVLPSHKLGCLEAEFLSLFPIVTMPHTMLCRQLNAHRLFVK